MNRNPCSGCGSQFCEGECFLQCEADFEPEEVDRHARFIESCRRAELRLTQTHSDPLLKRGAA